MGGIDPTRRYVLELLAAGKSVVSANKQLLARHGEELFAEAERNGVQLRFEASVCAAIPVIKVLRESMIVTGVHGIDGIVNGTTNFILTRMVQGGAPYADALARGAGAGLRRGRPDRGCHRRRRRRQDRAPGLGRLPHPRAASRRSTTSASTASTWPTSQHAAELGYAVKLIASARRVGADDLRPRAPLPARRPTTRWRPSRARSTPCMLRGDSIREVILEGPGAGGEETATAVIGDLLAVIGTRGTGFLEHDGYYRELDRFGADELRSACYLRFSVDDTPGVLAQVATGLADRGVSVAQVVQHSGAGGVHIVILTHVAAEGAVRAAARARRRARFNRSGAGSAARCWHARLTSGAAAIAAATSAAERRPGRTRRARRPRG